MKKSILTYGAFILGAVISGGVIGTTYYTGKRNAYKECLDVLNEENTKMEGMVQDEEEAQD